MTPPELLSATRPDVPLLAGGLLSLGVLEPTDLAALLDLASQMAEEPDGFTIPGRQSVACLFEKPSTRTRVSLQTAAHRLGLLPISLAPSELQLGRGEPLEDTAQVLSGYCGAIVARVHAHETLVRLAAAADVPVINALCDRHHPLQALADLLTLRDRFGELAGLTLAYVGDADANVAHSLIEAAALAGMHLVVAAPTGYTPQPAILSGALAICEATGGSVSVVADPADAAFGADAVTTDVWVSMGDEAERDLRLRELEAYRVDEALMAQAAPHAVFLHCLPAHRGEEVSAAVIDGPQSVVFAQAANRLPTTQAVLYAALAGGPTA